ncbi:MAG: MFS transporter [Prochlorococcus sp.]
MSDHNRDTTSILSGSNLNNPEPTLPTGANPEGRRGLQAVLKLDGFRRLWIGQIFSQLADKFYIVLMVYLIDSNISRLVGNTDQGIEGLKEITGSMPTMASQTNDPSIDSLVIGIFVANTIPAMVLGTVAGVWADRWPKRRVMVASNALRALLVLLAPVCILPGPHWIGLSWGYWALLVMTFLESVLTQFFAPAEQAAIPLLVPREHLLAANSLYQATSMGATIVGFALGFPILHKLQQIFNGPEFFGVNLGGQFLLLPFCYGMAAISLSMISMQEQRRSRSKVKIWDEISEGLQVLRKRPKVRGAMVHLVLLYSLLAALYVLSLNLASSIQGLGRMGFGTLLASSGLGMAIGAVIVAQIGHDFSRHRLAATGLGAISWSLVLLGQLRGTMSFTLLLCGVLGAGAALVAIPAQTTIQEETPEAQRGKVFGLQNNLINIALSLPLALAGALVSGFGLVPVLWLLAALALLAALLERPWQRC